MALDEIEDNVIQFPSKSSQPKPTDPIELAQQNNERAQQMGVALDPISLLAERINLVLKHLDDPNLVRDVETDYQVMISNVLDRAAEEYAAHLKAEAEAKLLLPPSELTIASKVIPDIAGGDVRGDRNSQLRKINDQWGQ